jgi:tetratricopeptide (TPR) repeat protein
MSYNENIVMEWSSDRAALSYIPTELFRSTAAVELSLLQPTSSTSTNIATDGIQEKVEHEDAAVSVPADEGMGVFSFRCPTQSREDNVNPLLQQGRMLLFRSHEYHSRRDYDAAIVHYQQALDAATAAAAAAASTATADSTPVNAATHAPKNNHNENAAGYIIIPSLTNIGILCYHRRQWTLAAAYLELAMTHCMLLLGNDSMELAHILNCTGVVLYQSALSVSNQPEAEATVTAVAVANSDAALFFLHEAHRITSLFTTFESQRPAPASSNAQFLATICYNLGRLFMHRTSYTEALLYYGLAWQQRSDILGPGHLDTIACVFGIGQVYHLMGRDDTALTLYNRAIESEAFRSCNHCRDCE